MTWLDSGSDATGTAALLTRDRNTPARAADAAGAVVVRLPAGAAAAVVRRRRRRWRLAAGAPPRRSRRSRQARWPRGHGGPGGPGGHGEPEYFGDGGYPHGAQGAPHDPYAANNPGHTQAFSINEDPYTQGGTHHAGSAPPPGPVGPRLRWQELLKGIVLSPAQTFLRMRDYSMWAPALIVTFLYGLLAVFGFDTAREDAISATLSNAVPIVLTTSVAMVLSAFILGVVTHTMARQLGGDGAWQPTVGLSMLIMSLTDAPRLVVAMFAGGDASFVQLLGWATWVAAGALLTIMVSRSHDLPGRRRSALPPSSWSHCCRS
ncbi:hypothetical protein SHKM778_01880 [Streptomyces sp. KM77-8]|uniref:Yip1 domain-containing protein n=1 Tax=Streptomyces haneummycinicus TaxID=3074435 RepID=A0AAT9H8W1_9ACTN